MEKEQHYLDTLEPEYNILKIAARRGVLGQKRSEETKVLMSKAQKSVDRTGEKIQILVKHFLKKQKPK